MISSGARVVFAKEVVDNLRDRRTFAAALLYPFLGPGLILIMVLAIGELSKEAERPLKLPVAGGQNAPNLVAFLAQNRAEIEDAPTDPEAAVRGGEKDLVLVIPPGFGEDFRSGRPATVRMVVDPSRNDTLTAIQRADTLLRAYGEQVGRLRLQARGVDAGIVDAIAIETIDVSTPQSQGARMLAMAPYLVIISLFVGGMYLAIDSTAGERERGSLEPLLINPVSRTDLVLGKAAAVFLFTLVALVETLIGFAAILNLVPLERYLGVRMSLPPASLATILIVSVPLMVFVVGLQLMIASYTKSFKEAQNYISVMLLVPALPALVLTILPVDESVWLALVPTVGQQFFINQILRAEEVRLSHLLLSSLVTLGIGAMLLYFVVRRYAREAILFR